MHRRLIDTLLHATAMKAYRFRAYTNCQSHLSRPLAGMAVFGTLEVDSSLGGSSDMWHLEHSGMFQTYTIRRWESHADSTRRRAMYLTVSATADSSLDPPFAVSLNSTSGVGGSRPHPGHDAFLEWRVSSANIGTTVQLTHVVNHFVFLTSHFHHISASTQPRVQEHARAYTRTYAHMYAHHSHNIRTHFKFKQRTLTHKYFSPA